MFGYIVINQSEMKFKEYDVYRSYYCGLCQSLKERYGVPPPGGRVGAVLHVRQRLGCPDAAHRLI